MTNEGGLKPLSPQAHDVLVALGDSTTFPHGLCRADALRVLNIQNLTSRIAELRAHGINVRCVKAVVRNGLTHTETKMSYWQLASRDI